MIALKIIIASTRVRRKGPIVADWIFEEAKKRTEFETELLDLKVINLPFLDEPEQPSLRRYTMQSTKDWSAIIEKADAFITVMPEYNHGFPATIKNAIDTVYKEWNDKPMAFVSYAGISGGTRAVQLIKPVLTAVKMVPVTETVVIPFFRKHIQNEKFVTDEKLEKYADRMFKSLARWAELLKEMRLKKAEMQLH